jgi:peroxiredoxin
MRILAIAILMCTSLAASASEAPRAAPDFTLKSAGGKSVRLSEHVGEVVFVNFWATWCGPCRDELPVLERLQRQYGKAGFVVLGVNMDEDANAARAMARRLDVTFPLLFDQDKQTAKRYDVASMPASFLVDRDGRLRHKHLGFVPQTAEDYEREIRSLLKE